MSLNSSDSTAPTFSTSTFSKLERIGQGTYGSVYRAIHKSTDTLVALKRIKLPEDKEGLPKSAVRELRILRKLQSHPNIVSYHGLATSFPDKNRNRMKGGLYMVLEYTPHDLSGFLEYRNRSIEPAEAKNLIHQLFMAVDYCHMRGIAHRDLKNQNCLISFDGRLILCDFGLARETRTLKNGINTSRVITSWYRPPELLLGATEYGAEVDLWSAGAMAGELIVGRPLFAADKERQVLELIVDVVGVWSGWEGLANWKEWVANSGALGGAVLAPAIGLVTRPREKLKNVTLRDLTKNASELVRAMLDLDPKKRLSCAAALHHPFFTEEAPSACKDSELLLPPDSCLTMRMKEIAKGKNSQRLD